MPRSDAGLDTVVAGIRCRDVLDALSEFLDGQVSPDQRTALVAHLSACDRCARFGGDMSQLLDAMRAALTVPAHDGSVHADQLRANRVRTALHKAQLA